MSTQCLSPVINYCSQCGSQITQYVPGGEHQARNICKRCDAVFYENPKIIVVSLIECNNKILLCKRANKPRQGCWTLPGGYMENDETIEEAAIRETKEETDVTIANLKLYALFDCPMISQVYFVFRGRVNSDYNCENDESSEVDFFSECEVPWENLSYSIIRQALDWYFQDKTEGKFKFRSGNSNEICFE